MKHEHETVTITLLVIYSWRLRHMSYKPSLLTVSWLHEAASTQHREAPEGSFLPPRRARPTLHEGARFTHGRRSSAEVCCLGPSAITIPLTSSFCRLQVVKGTCLHHAHTFRSPRAFSRLHLLLQRVSRHAISGSSGVSPPSAGDLLFFGHDGGNTLVGVLKPQGIPSARSYRRRSVLGTRCSRCLACSVARERYRRN